MRIRSFISLPASPSAQQRIAEVQMRLREEPADVRWESSEKLHITLRFLGDIEENDLDELAHALGPQLRGLPSFRISYNALGTFPGPTHPRIIWIGIEENAHVLEVERIVTGLCRERRLGRDEARAFHPHITLGRVKSSRGIGSLTATLKTITFEPIEDLCAGVHIMRSDLRPTGSRYTLMYSIPLQP
jgi:2'-5' RNA ligase